MTHFKLKYFDYTKNYYVDSGFRFDTYQEAFKYARKQYRARGWVIEEKQNAINDIRICENKSPFETESVAASQEKEVES